ncbi:hypothetical protein DSD19_04625 [Rhodovulum sp. BSW8]|uniref:hypothetical protein n=1 Tax=Rhodovulum sp. BSW8 TaxID=2259645 RepID=UPI000DE4DFD1|nr:hypothetical protein [Rhodovulum sp. BSW8]RBO54665.1 hypothetical protein DSD19_04625 [Rhodovulum sp. BSW8]
MASNGFIITKRPRRLTAGVAIYAGSESYLVLLPGDIPHWAPSRQSATAFPTRNNAEGAIRAHLSPATPHWAIDVIPRVLPYVAEEPEEATVWKDKMGAAHDSREEAIRANFEADLSTIISDILMSNRQLPENRREAFRALLGVIADEHPDMLRILMGDREET